MLNLVIDIGNTFSKIALFNNREMTELKVSEGIVSGSLESWFQKYPIDNAVISTVKNDTGDLEGFLSGRCHYFRFHTGMRAGIVNKYKTPETLGLDRYAAVIGAKALFPGRNCLVIDAGTCITYDFIDSEGVYYGGSISPGIRMRFMAMNTFTDRLPLISFDELFEADYGLDTKDAMLSGGINGVIFEAEGFIDRFYRKWPDLKVLLCGGDVNFFDRRLKNSIFARNLKAEPHLVLIGLNEVIYQYNE